MSVPLHEEQRQQQARDALDYIRRTMESASSFTAVSGWGLIAVGLVGLAAAWVAWSTGEPAELMVWLPTVVIAIAVAMVANAWKARRLEVPLWSGSFRKLAWVMMPVIAAGGMLTWALAENGQMALVPGTWLALYGAGITAGGTLSVRAIRTMGLVLLVLGGVAFARPAWNAALLATGFGLVHLVFGARLVWKHGG
ncbi:MAG: hypothetical protein R3266_13515 [Gemmatimonadota bacterium]|nr:hypothetical protein [Gemmatimonadota bacterium]